MLIIIVLNVFNVYCFLHNLIIGKTRWTLKNSWGCLYWNHVRGCVEHKWITTIWRQCLHWKYKTLKTTTIYRCTLLLNIMERCYNLKSIVTKKYSILYYTPISLIPCECEILNLKTISTKRYSIMYINILSIQIHLNV